jgi:hypothetical protein
LIDKELMIDPIKIKKSLAVKIQVAEKGTNTSPVEVRTMSDVIGNTIGKRMRMSLMVTKPAMICYFEQLCLLSWVSRLGDK